jgi:long-chain acyl-CoA synthetase
MNNFLDLINKIQEYGDEIAFVDYEKNITLSYSDFVESIYETIDKLPVFGVGEKIILYKINSIDWVVLYFSIILRGGVAVPIDDRVSNEFVLQTINLTGSEYIFTDKDDVVKEFVLKKVKVINPEYIKKNKKSNIKITYDTDENRLSVILFTSGSWSIPKGVMLSQKNIMTNVNQILDRYDQKQEYCMLSMLPLSHAYQQTVGMITPLSCGSKNVFLDKPDSYKLIDAIQSHGVSSMIVVPKILNLLQTSILRKISHIWVRNLFQRFVVFMADAPLYIRKIIFSNIRKKIGYSLHTFLVGGAILPPHLDKFFQGLGYNVYIGYGLTETSPVLTISSSGIRKKGSIGFPLQGIEYSLSEQKELIVKGDNVFLGYYPDLRKDDNFNTGDIVSITHSGEIILKGRTKNMIIWPTGDKIFSEDLENIIIKDLPVQDVCVVSKNTDDSVPEIFIAYIPEENVKINIADIQSIVPSHVKITGIKSFSKDSFPYTHTLKPNRKEILDIFTK